MPVPLQQCHMYCMHLQSLRTTLLPGRCTNSNNVQSPWVISLWAGAQPECFPPYGQNAAGLPSTNSRDQRKELDLLPYTDSYRSGIARVTGCPHQQQEPSLYLVEPFKLLLQLCQWTHDTESTQMAARLETMKTCFESTCLALWSSMWPCMLISLNLIWIKQISRYRN